MNKIVILMVSAVLLQACSGEKPEINDIGQADCIDGHCLLKTGGLSVTLEMPEQIKPLESFQSTVSLQGFTDVASVEVDFIMPGMDMGKNRYQFAGSNLSGWQGQSILPVCVTGRSDWQAVVEVNSAGQTYRAKFGFVVDR